VGSRRGTEALIAAGRVAVNGAVTTSLATFVAPGDRVTVDGREVSPPARKTTVLLHKPVGVVTTASDPQGRRTVLDLLPPRPRVFPVGRLDRDTSGALLLTDDGELAHQILHPAHGVEKEYVAEVEGTLDHDALELLRNGLLLPGEDRPTAPARVRVESPSPAGLRLRIVVHEGRNRQVRRMLEAVGHPVLSLIRERIGPVTLGGLAPGAWRLLSPDEVSALVRESRGASRPAPRSPSPESRRPRRTS
jgi:pseudouridine synthase